MYSLNSEKYKTTKERVERLHRRYSKYHMLTKGQVTSKILDDLGGSFFDDPAIELSAYISLAQINENSIDTLIYLQREYRKLIANVDFDSDYEMLDDDNIKKGMALLNKSRKDMRVVLS